MHHDAAQLSLVDLGENGTQKCRQGCIGVAELTCSMLERHSDLFRQTDCVKHCWKWHSCLPASIYIQDADRSLGCSTSRVARGSATLPAAQS